MFKKSKKSVDSILAVFTTAITDLEDVITTTNTEAAVNTETIKKLEDTNKALKVESTRASNVITKLRDLTEM